MAESMPLRVDRQHALAHAGSLDDGDILLNSESLCHDESTDVPRLRTKGIKTRIQTSRDVQQQRQSPAEESYSAIESCSKPVEISFNTDGIISARSDQPRQESEPSQQAQNDKKPSIQRQCHRQRRKWTDQETEHLKRGIALCGVGRWKDILNHPNLSFHEYRTHVDLKDRFRVLFPPNRPDKWSGKIDSPPAMAAGTTHVAQPKVRKPAARSRAKYIAWTEAEDAELLKGFKKHGFKWHVIAQDESVHLNRTARQISDRFRNIEPHVYSGNSNEGLVHPQPAETATQFSSVSPQHLHQTAQQDNPVILPEYVFSLDQEIPTSSPFPELDDMTDYEPENLPFWAQPVPEQDQPSMTLASEVQWGDMAVRPLFETT